MKKLDRKRVLRRAQEVCLAALTIAAEGSKADIVKPMTGMGLGVFEIAPTVSG